MSAANNPARYGRGYQTKFANRFRANVTGAEELMRDLQKMGRAGIEEARVIFDRKATQIVAMAKPLTPHEPEFGTALRDSVRKTRVIGSATRGKVTVTILAGGAPLEDLLRRHGHTMNVYAYIQHEDLTLKHPGGGGPKFIERPVMQMAPTIPGELRAAVVKAVESGR